MLYYNDKGKGKPFMDYVLVVTVMWLWWKTGRSPINRTNKLDKAVFYQAWLEKSLYTENLLYMALWAVVIYTI